MPDMMSMINNMLAPLPSDGVWTAYQIVSLVLLALMVLKDRVMRDIVRGGIADD